MYADWKSQVAYSSPNWNGFSFTAGVTQAWNALGADSYDATNSSRGGNSPAFEAKASYEWAGDVSGKVWVSGISQRVKDLTSYFGTNRGSDRATAYDIGATVNVAGFGLTGYYGKGDGIGQTVQLARGFDWTGKSRDSDQWYVQGTYTIPGVGTKLGASYGKSTLEGNSNDYLDEQEDSMWTVGAYHPLTKHLNLVAEYSEAKYETSYNFAAPSDEVKAKTISLGAILFF
jgi:hypothetical protein